MQGFVLLTILSIKRNVSVFKNHASGVMSIAFCGDILLSCGADGTMKKRSLQGNDF